MRKLSDISLKAFLFLSLATASAQAQEKPNAVSGLFCNTASQVETYVIATMEHEIHPKVVIKKINKADGHGSCALSTGVVDSETAVKDVSVPKATFVVQSVRVIRYIFRRGNGVIARRPKVAKQFMFALKPGAVTPVLGRSI